MSISLDAEFCIETLEEALSRYGKLTISKGDQTRSSRAAFTAMLLRENIAISMDGKGC